MLRSPVIEVDAMYLNKSLEGDPLNKQSMTYFEYLKLVTDHVDDNTVLRRIDGSKHVDLPHVCRLVDPPPLSAVAKKNNGMKP